ncbi:MAG: thioredoxin family protein [Thermoplasmata archaeon]|uniref:Thioredoxin family protein n=1 Tax=Candidatus Sysuiplasma superficiale TaxID=2823368 RepID=A0A8J8CDW4_9ARCH|nr:thioredoxin family protein [Candidatus Sysuiplasma superficiale]MBX8644037.1 thioredoxin family protein [Candidatus Sysuiplasma superficiale]MCL5437139.1 thioredoxin family protein [Candidatus Thermoplasmatota archaeon]
MQLIQEKERVKLKEIFDSELKGNVKLILFTSKSDCEYCDDTSQLLSEMAEISGGKLSVEKHDLEKEGELAEKYRVDKAPAIIIPFGSSEGVRYYGIPGGYEFMSLVEDMVDASKGSTELSETVRSEIRKISSDVHIQVFVTPTCPWCPKAVRTAHQFAMENSRITADMVEASEFPDLAASFEVMAVPKVVINNDTSFEGAIPEDSFLDYVKKSLA